MPNEEKRREGQVPRRFKFIIAYDGSGFSGWQSQADDTGIQDAIENALARLSGEKIRLHGSGRTDAGVHALGQCAHADLATRLQPEALLAALNAWLPPAIRILRCRVVPASFHARFSISGKVYRYRIATGPVLLPFEVGRAWHVNARLDENLLRSGAEMFQGRHDFAGFAANRGSPVRSTIRTIHKVQVRISPGAITLEFDGEGFLYKMVRLMVGAIVQCALGKTELSEIQERLRTGRPLPHRLVAPAGGLMLVRVRYGKP